jgi:signal transduction histidine kinase
MGNKSTTVKITIIATLTMVITILHYGAIRGHLGLHILHRELYFIPILLASFWFGLKVGITTAVVISLIYAPHVFIYNDPHGTHLTVISQVLVFNLVAIVLGWLADRQRRQQQEMVEAENLTLLGQAAVAIGYEMKDIVGALKRTTHNQKKGLQSAEFDRDFEQELGRLENVVDTLSSFASPERIEMLSTDLNKIISERIEHYQSSASKSEVTLEAQLDERGCPTRVDAGLLGRVLDNLIKNAIEASNPGQTVIVRSHRGGLTCSVEVQDQGPGIRPEHLPKMFVPFFTTKEKGTGLGLAASKKIMHDLGGDIQVASTGAEGSTFTLTIPREQET